MENNTRQTRQRAVVLDLLKNTTSHPNAAALYDEARRVMPNISLGTVYRNIRLLEQSGTIRKLVLNSGVEHFDADLRPHHHFVCRSCGRVLDVGLNSELPSEKELEKCCGMRAEEGFEVESAEVIFYGVCPSCGGRRDSDGTERLPEKDGNYRI